MKKKISLFLIFLLIFNNTAVFSANKTSIDTVIGKTAQYIYETVKDPDVGSIGGEWAVLGLARSGAEIPQEYYQKYSNNVTEYITALNGVLHNTKYTEYSRIILALTSIGANPSNVMGYNLLTALGDYEKTVAQGVNGSIWALLALDSNNYEIPKNPAASVQATREMYINHILSSQLPDGGWTFYNKTAEDDSSIFSSPDMTGMALQALAKYQDNEKVKASIDKALIYISNTQSPDGGFKDFGTETSESCAQIIVALCELGISFEDSRFMKNGNTILDNLMTYYIKDNGFKHTSDESISNPMSTEQCFYSIVALKRFLEEKNSLYDMTDTVTSGITNLPERIGLPNKHPDITKKDIIYPEKTFTDIKGNLYQTEIEKLSQRNIINGKTEDLFDPENTIKRAEFTAIIVRGLGLPLKGVSTFDDVGTNDWFYDYVNTAYFYGIVNGVSEKAFNPNGTITREEAAVMVTRAAALCGIDTGLEDFNVRNILSEFTDYVKASSWALKSLAFCYDKKILSNEAITIKPKEYMKRSEIAYMLFNTLNLAKLL